MLVSIRTHASLQTFSASYVAKHPSFSGTCILMQCSPDSVLFLDMYNDTLTPRIVQCHVVLRSKSHWENSHPKIL